MRTKRSAVLALAASAALAIGVTAAWAGFPNMRTADSTFDAGTTTKGGGKTTTTTLRTFAAASPSSVPATLYVTFRATSVSESDTFYPYAEGSQEWACGNSGGEWPSDPKKFKSPVVEFGSQLTVVADRNGRFIYNGNELKIELTSPLSFSCPTGQTALLVSLTLTKFVLKVVGFTDEAAINFPTSAGWSGNTYFRPGFPF